MIAASYSKKKNFEVCIPVVGDSLWNEGFVFLYAIPSLFPGMESLIHVDEVMVHV